ncbi:MAG TPA: zinc ribbon domain-containing protein [Kineosporiaceae bacterium]|nr:zinc ribbon domain-containing protein [Kineosporiaceae bacterium]
MRVSATDESASICPNCGQENDQGRRFCGRCGEWLTTPSVTTPAPPVAFKDQLRRRWFGDRGPYSGSLSRATVGFRILVGVVAVTVLTAILGLANLHPIQRVKDQIGHVRGTGRVAGLTATALPAGDQPDPTARFAVDGVRARGWTTQWTATTDGDPDRACQAQPDQLQPGVAPAGATATSLAIDFKTAVDVREIGFEAGLVEPDERTDRWQPQTLELRWKNGECQSVDLKNSPDLQRFGVHAGLVGGVVITIVAGYAPADPGSRLDLGEVTVWQR